MRLLAALFRETSAERVRKEDIAKTWASEDYDWQGQKIAWKR